MRYKAIYFLTLFLIVWTVGKQGVGQSVTAVPVPAESPTPIVPRSPSPSILPFAAPSLVPSIASTQSPSPVPSQAPTPSPTPETRGVRTRSVSYLENGERYDLDLYEASYALVIGMNNYRHWRPLPGTETDVREVKAALEEHGFKVFTAFDLNSEDLQKRIAEFVTTYGIGENKRRIILYFAGHGHTLERKDGSKNPIGYIVPIDAPEPESSPAAENEFRRLAIDTEVIQSWAKRIDTTHSVFVFDSCFSGFATRSNSRVPPYISAYLKKPARQFMSSGSQSQKVPDNSVFRKHFVDGIRGAADSYGGDGFVTGRELASYVRAKVEQDRGSEQTPQSAYLAGTDYQEGDMVFSYRYSSDVTEEQAWKKADLENNVRAYQLFKNSFPSSSYASLAMDRLISIRLKESAGSGHAGAPLSAGTRGVGPTFGTLEFTTVSIDERGVSRDRRPMKAQFMEEDLGGGQKLKLVKLTGKAFKMGSDVRENEKPVRQVSVGDYHMGIYEVTRQQWNVVVGWEKVKLKLRPASILSESEANVPITDISWEEAKEFCSRLNIRTGRLYSLPTEAEWEFAARAGTTTQYPFGPAINQDVANYDPLGAATQYSAEASLRRLIAVGSRRLANPFGLFDMNGNAAEWCEDDFLPHYDNAPPDSSARKTGGDMRVIRGGSFGSKLERITVSARNPLGYDQRDTKVGFRVVMRSFITNPLEK